MAPNFADPAVRKQAWEQGIMNYLRATLAPDKAVEIIVAYADGKPWAKQRFERAHRELQAREKTTSERAAALAGNCGPEDSRSYIPR